MLAHRLDKYVLEHFLLGLILVLDEESRKQRDGEDVCVDLWRRDLQHRAVIEAGVGKDMIRCSRDCL